MEMQELGLQVKKTELINAICLQIFPRDGKEKKKLAQLVGKLRRGRIHFNRAYSKSSIKIFISEMDLED